MLPVNWGCCALWVCAAITGNTRSSHHSGIGKWVFVAVRLPPFLHSCSEQRPVPAPSAVSVICTLCTIAQHLLFTLPFSAGRFLPSFHRLLAEAPTTRPVSLFPVVCWNFANQMWRRSLLCPPPLNFLSHCGKVTGISQLPLLWEWPKPASCRPRLPFVATVAKNSRKPVDCSAGFVSVAADLPVDLSCWYLAPVCSCYLLGDLALFNKKPSMLVLACVSTLSLPLLHFAGGKTNGASLPTYVCLFIHVCWTSRRATAVWLLAVLNAQTPPLKIITALRKKKYGFGLGMQSWSSRTINKCRFFFFSCEPKFCNKECVGNFI